MPVHLDPQRALLMVVDMQEKLLRRIDGHEQVLDQVLKLIKACNIIGIPILYTEQYPQGLGPTHPSIPEAIGGDEEPIVKMTFSCFASDPITGAVQATEREQLILCGIEAHVCILQTALQALEDDWEVFVVEDAVGSRRAADRETALRRLDRTDVIPASVEMLIMEALGQAGTETFKAVLPLLKD